MKTLKKTLCLVLAVVMVVGVLILPASAATTTAAKDSLETKYKEALEVLKATAIYQGDEGGLRADDPITRREVTAIVARMKETEEMVKDYPATGLTFADCADLTWGQGYIAYCQDKAIVTGDENGFRPDDNVTGYEFAKMLLVALGFDAAENGFYGDAWAGNVYSTVIKTKLNKGLSSINWNAPIKRGEVAQLTLNALTYTEDGGKWYKVTMNDEVLYEGDDYNQAMLFAQTTGAKVEATDTTNGSLADVMYNGLHKVEGHYDVFARPIILWQDKDGDVVNYTKTADATYNGTFTKAIGDTLTNYAVYYNGDLNAVAKNDLYYNNGGVNGYEVEVYNAEKRIIVREAYVAQVGTADAAAKTIQLTVWGDKGGAADNVATKTFTVASTDRIYASLSTFGANNYVAAYVKPGWDAADATPASVLELSALNKVVTTVTRIDDNMLKTNSLVTTAERTYMINNEALIRTNDGMRRNVMGGPTRALWVGAATLYTLNDNILFVDVSTVTPPSTTTYAMHFAYCFDIKKVDVTAAGSSDWASEGGVVTGSTNHKYMVRLLLTDNTVVEKIIPDAVVDGTEAEFEAAKTKYLGKLVSYSVDAKTDVYTLKVLSELNQTDMEITHNKAEGKLGGNKVLFDSKTIFLVVTTKDTATAKPNWKLTAEFYSIYTVPDVKSAARVFAGDFNSVNGDHNDVGENQVADVVVIVDPNKAPSTEAPVTTGTYFIVGYENATKTRILLDDGTSYVEYIQYNAVVDGKITTVNVEVTDSKNPDFVSLALGNEIKFVKDPKLETIGGITMITNWGTTDLTVAATTLTVNGVSDIVNDKIKINANDVSAAQADYLASVQVNTLAFEYDLTKGTIVELKLGDIKASAGTTGYAVQNDAHTILSFLYLANVAK